MSKYYIGRYAQNYNTRWRTLIERTHAEVLAIIDIAALQSIQERLGRRPRVLDIACGTGLLLKKLFDCVPDLDIYGVDASIDMLAQARIILKDAPNVHLQQAVIGAGKTISLPYPQGYFDLITCTNALHYLPDLVIVLRELRRLLAPEGYIVIQDYILPEPPFPWAILERFAKRVGQQHMHQYTLAEAQPLCKVAGFHVVLGKTFVIDRVMTLLPARILGWSWRGWVLQLSLPISV